VSVAHVAERALSSEAWGLPAASLGGGGGGIEISGEALIGLFILFVAAKAGEEVARRMRQPGVIGELLGGFIVGPFALGLVAPGTTAAVMSELGVVVLLFAVGLEVRIDDLLSVGRMAITVGVLGFVLPIAAGAAIGLAVGQDVLPALLIGLALAATSIGITSRVLAEMGVLDRAFARVVLGAAIVDDILALLAIGLLSGFATGDLSASTLLVIVAGLGFVGLGLAIARRARHVPRNAFTWPLFAETPLVPVFILMFGGAIAASLVGLAAIIGAFVAGLIIAETPVREEVEHEMGPLVAIFAPFFFAVTGAAIDLSALLEPGPLVLVVVLAVMGILTKLVGGYLGSRRLGRWNAVTVGVGMAPRGEVGIVVAALGLGLGLVDGPTYAVLLAAVVVTTIVAPVLLARVVPLATRGEHRDGATLPAPAAR
jgi:Kef-type K+ transport system membrane component KefB